VNNYRGIPEPNPAAVRVRVTVKAKSRAPRPLDYVKTPHSFLIELSFNSDVDLAVFERVVKRSPVRLFEYLGTPTRLFVTDDRIPFSCDVEELNRWVQRELPRINAAAGTFCPGYIGATFRALFKLFPNGTAGHIMESPPFAPPPLILDKELSVILAIEDNLLVGVLDKIEDDPDFAEAMTYVGQALTHQGAQPWADLYRACEIVEQHVGGEHKLYQKLHWCTKDQLSRFGNTANHQKAIGVFSRHARSKQKPPEEPMPFWEARRFILGLMKRWLNENNAIL